MSSEHGRQGREVKTGQLRIKNREKINEEDAI
jgi:hypothetical protein